MDRFKIIIILATVIFITGCSRLEVSKLDNSITRVQPGLAYSLQFTQFKIDVTRGIANCEKTFTQTKTSLLGGGSITSTVTVPDVKALVKADITSESVDDGDFVYVIDSESLNGLTKISELTVKWEKGRLTAINAAADDQSAEVISGVAKGIGKLAISAINPVSTIAAASPANIVQCNSETAAALKELKTHEADIKTISQAISNLTVDIATHEKELNRIGKNPTLDCTDTQNINSPQCLLEKKIIELRENDAKLKVSTRKMQSALAKVSYKETYRWPLDSKTDSRNGLDISQAMLDKWLINTSTITISPPPHQQSKASFKSQFDVSFKLGKIGTYGRNNLSGSYTDEAGSEAGIRYRLAANGYIAVCRLISTCDRDKDETIATVLNPIQQFGHVFSIPFESKAFSKGSIAVTFDDQGRPKEASIKSPESSLENITGSLNDIIDQVVSYRAADAAANPEKTELELIQEQTALLAAQQELANAQRTLDVGYSPLDELRDKTALAEQEKLYLDAIKALNDSAAAKNDQTDDELAAIQADTTLIMAETSRLQAQIALRQAQQALDKL